MSDSSQSDSRLTRRQRATVTALAVVCILLAGAAVVTAQYTFGDNTVSFEEQGQPDWVDNVISGSWDWDDSNAAVGNESVRNTASGDFDAYDPFNYSGVVDNASFFINRESSASQPTESVQFREYDGDGCSGDCYRGIALDIQGDGSVTFRNFGDTGIDIPSDGWVMVKLEEIDYSNHTFSISVRDSSGEVGSNESVSFSNENANDVGMVTVGLGEGTRLDHVSVNNDVPFPTDGTVPGDEDLRLDVPGYLQHNASSSYAVEVNQSGVWTDVTADATVTPDNTDALTFYENGTVVAGGNKSINERVDVTAEYQDLTATDYTVVATPTVDNLDLLPVWWKVNATVGDGAMLWLIVGTLFAVVAARAATAWAGIGAYVMVLIMGWMTGAVPTGITIAATLAGMFLGLNLAANVDTTIRGSG